MKKNIHPNQQLLDIKCISCDAEFSFNSTTKDITIDVCSHCHPFYLGTTVSLKAAGRIDRFKNRLAKAQKAK